MVKTLQNPLIRRFKCSIFFAEENRKTREQRWDKLDSYSPHSMKVYVMTDLTQCRPQEAEVRKQVKNFTVSPVKGY
jgi:hypothetical protein